MDVKSKPGAADRSHIDLNQPHKVNYWTEVLGVSENEPATAVKGGRELGRQGQSIFEVRDAVLAMGRSIEMRSRDPRRSGEDAKQQMDEKAGPWAKTEAFENFEANLEPLMGLVEPKIQRLDKAIRTAQEIVNEKISADTSPDIEVIRIAVDQIGEDVRAYVKETRFTVQWLCVMLVTFITTYLEDAFVYLALKNSVSMKEAAPLPDQTIVEAETIDDLRCEMMHRWAVKAVQGGPKGWFALLKKLGARDYKDDTQFLLTHLWDTRNRVVQGRGTADASYVKTYGSLKLTRGDSIPLTNKTLKWWLDGLSHFTETTDRLCAHGTSPNRAESKSLVPSRFA